MSSAPPMSTWSAEVEGLAVIADKLSVLGYILKKVNGDKESQPPKPSLRPETAMPTIKRRHRQEQHDKLTARLLGR
jgi:cobyrinic acid a,c-diamide synthase